MPLPPPPGQEQPDMGNPITAQPDHSEHHLGMVDHSELVKRLRYYATRGMDAYVVAADCDRAADALEAIGETK